MTSRTKSDSPPAGCYSGDPNVAATESLEHILKHLDRMPVEHRAATIAYINALYGYTVVRTSGAEKRPS